RGIHEQVAGVSVFNQLNRRCIGPRQISPTLEYFGSEVVEPFMSTKKNVILTLVLCFGACAIAQAKPTDAELINQAKVKRNEAHRIALKQAPQGTIKSAEIEN